MRQTRSLSHRPAGTAGARPSTSVSYWASGRVTPWKADSGWPKASRSRDVLPGLLQRHAPPPAPAADQRAREVEAVHHLHEALVLVAQGGDRHPHVLEKIEPRPMARWPWQSKRLVVMPGAYPSAPAARLRHAPSTGCRCGRTPRRRCQPGRRPRWRSSPLMTYSSPTRSIFAAAGWPRPIRRVARSGAMAQMPRPR